MCSSPFSATRKLRTLGAKGHTCKGTPLQASTEQSEQFYNKCYCCHVLFFIQDQLFNHPTSFLINTGSPVLLLKNNLWNLLKPPGTVLSPWGGNKLVGVNGTSIHSQGSHKVTIKIMDREFVSTMVIIDDLAVTQCHISWKPTTVI